MKEKIWTRDFALICVANFFIFLGFQMTLPTVPLLVQSLGGTDQIIGLITGVFSFSSILFRPYAGHALESKGRQPIYMLGLAIFVLSVGSYAIVPSIIFLILMRLVQGAGWGLSTTATGTIVSDFTPQARRGEGMAYFGFSGNLALAIGPSLGLTLAGALSYTQLFLIIASTGLIAFVLASRIQYKKIEDLPQPEKSTTVKFDIFEKSAVTPSILLFFVTVTFGGITSFLPLYTAQEGVSGIEFYFLFYAIALLISKTFAGKLYDVKGHIYVFLPGGVLVVLAMLTLFIMPDTWALLLAGTLYGLGFGSIQPALQAWAINQSPANRRGMANATFFGSFDLGVGTGAMVFGLIATAFGYAYIYLAAALSVATAMVIYTILVIKKWA
ncbi:Predicted arabinose efflux permease, MFS family [Pelagirhabdus alkalitolerans]|uniref:Predicted arabinose efflux permease, MFS family n=1 Tax=Pelagirhabdus alkalitolerans TaxID=1612202 RepID=A0A1G6GHI4_9BACI|nr:MFS transporter [Pelagirhabdus alkalitolerans]SDB81215.1 Predicted arabinose efflux permease, MFS family [Pelagirhabdus alkalitolerans]